MLIIKESVLSLKVECSWISVCIETLTCMYTLTQHHLVHLFFSFKYSNFTI